MALKNKKNHYGFTIIELLVVIAIIGLLSSIVIVSTKGTKEKAKYTTILQFSSSINHLLGAYPVLGFNFNEGVKGTCSSGKDVCDITGLGNDGKWENPNWVDSDFSYDFKKSAKFIITQGNYVLIELNKAYKIELNKEQGFTVQFWYRAPENINMIGVFNKGSLPDEILYNFSYVQTGTDKCVLALSVWCGGTEGYDIQTDYSALKPSTWYHFVITMGETSRIYVNGEIIASKSGNCISAMWESADAKIAIGTNLSGLIDEFYIYNQDLSLTQIRNFYAVGSYNHRN